MTYLTELAAKYGTDKGATHHFYTEIYEEYLGPLRGLPITLLEIGVASGASIRMWRDYFPKGQIVGVDHNTAYLYDFGEKLINEDNSDRISLLEIEATDLEQWKLKLHRDLDVVIEDGGHFSTQIIGGFEGTWPWLKSGGLYIIEDIHAIYHYDGGMNFFPWLQNKMHKELNEHGEPQSGKRFSGDIEFIHLYKSLAIIKKR